MTTRSTRGTVVLVLVAAILGGMELAGCASYEGARLYQRGTRALDRGDPVSAVADLERAAELVPEASEVQNHLGLAYAAAGRDREARRAFQRAVDLDCDNHAALENLQVTQRKADSGEAP